MSGVSTATVSRVLNSSGRVSPQLKERVQAVVEQTGFVPNQLAKNLYTNSSNSIALFIYDIMNPFFTKLIKELNRTAFDRGYSLIICDTENERERELRYTRYVQSIRVSGVILTEGLLQETVTELKDRIPTVLIDRSPGEDNRFSLITSANRQGAQKAVEYLVRLNHTKIAFVGGPTGMRTAAERKLGYLDVMNKHGLPVAEEYMFTGDFRIDSGIKAAEHFLSLEDPPTAVFCANDLMAQGVLLRALSLNLSAPDDFSLIGFDGVISGNFYRRLTTVRQSVETIATAAMDQMLNLIHNREHKPRVIVPTRLIIGETCKKL